MANPSKTPSPELNVRVVVRSLLWELPERPPADIVACIQAQHPRNGLPKASLLALVGQERAALLHRWQLHYRYKTAEEQEQFRQLRVAWLDRFLLQYWESHKDFPGYELIRETCRQVFGSSLRDTEIRDARDRWLANRQPIPAPKPTPAPQQPENQPEVPVNNAPEVAVVAAGHRIEADALDKLTEVMEGLVLARGTIETLNKQIVVLTERNQELVERVLHAEADARGRAATVERLGSQLAEAEDKLDALQRAPVVPVTTELTVSELIRQGRGVTITPVMPHSK